MLPRDVTKLASLAAARTAQHPLSRAKDMCHLCSQLTNASGVALSVAVAEPLRLSTVCGTDRLSVRLEELQLGLGEGPIEDALHSCLPVMAPDLFDPSRPRWPWFAQAAVESGVGALFVVPLRTGRTPMSIKSVGALSLYRADSGDLTASQLADFRTLSDAATRLLLASSESVHEPESWTMGEGTEFEPAIPQAVGMIMTQLDVDATQAFARLRGHAFAAEASIHEVAHDVVTRALRLDPTE